MSGYPGYGGQQPYGQQPSQGYPPQGQQYPPQQGQYPPQQGQYPPQQGQYPPSQQPGKPAQQGQYPPTSGVNQPGQYGQPAQPYGSTSQTPGGYKPPTGQVGAQVGAQSSTYPPSQGAYGAPQQGAYPPSQGAYGSAQQGAYPPSQGAYGAPSTAQGLPNKPSLPPIGQTGYGSQPSAPGWAASYGTGVNPQEMAVLQNWFNSVDTDRSGNISANELATMSIMNRPLGIEAARKLIKVFDKDYSGTVDFNEFVSLNRFMNTMQGAFFAADQDRSGFLDYREIFNAMSGAGFQLTYPTIQAVCEKYDVNRSGQISAEAFVNICSQLAAVRSIFEWNDTQRTGKVTLSYDQLAHITIHLDRP